MTVDYGVIGDTDSTVGVDKRYAVVAVFFIKAAAKVVFGVFSCLHNGVINSRALNRHPTDKVVILSVERSVALTCSLCLGGICFIGRNKS